MINWEKSIPQSSRKNRKRGMIVVMVREYVWIWKVNSEQSRIDWKTHTSWENKPQIFHWWRTCYIYALFLIAQMNKNQLFLMKLLFPSIAKIHHDIGWIVCLTYHDWFDYPVGSHKDGKNSIQFGLSIFTNTVYHNFKS